MRWGDIEFVKVVSSTLILIESLKHVVQNRRGR